MSNNGGTMGTVAAQGAGAKQFVPRPHYERTRDDQRNVIDDIRFTIVPRYKTSGLSGDEWRISVVVELRRKGEVMFSRPYCDMDTAAAHLPWVLRTWCEEAGDEWSRRIRADEAVCHQAGCSAPATVVYRKKQSYCDTGRPHAIGWGEVRRAFCGEHSTRGDCGLDDADVNYEKLNVQPDVQPEG